jgi:hypothetical protein
MTPHDKAIARLRRRLGLALFLKYALAAVTAWAFLWGTAAVVLRLAAAVAPATLLWGLAAVPALVVLAALATRRRLPPAPAVRALLDRAGRCGGLLVAGEDRDLGPWQEALPPPAALRVRWHGSRSWALAAAAVLFLLAALLFPERLATLGATRALEIDREVAKLAAQVDLLKQEDVFTEERAEDLKEKLRRLKQHSSGRDPAKTLEALDHLQDVVSRAAKEAAESAVKQAEGLARAEALAEALHRAAGEVSPKVEKEALAELAALVKKAAAENRALGRHLDEKTRKDAAAGKLSRDEMKKLAGALRGSKQDLERALEKLSEARLIDSEMLRAAQKAGEWDRAALAALLKGEGGKLAVAEMLAAARGKGDQPGPGKEGPGKGKVKGGSPGKGGLTEGPGAAELTFGDKKSEAAARFKEQALPPAALRALKESRLAGLDKEAPKAGKAEASRPGALGQAAAGGGSANTQVILPRHRAVVERYFTRPARKSGRGGDE